GGIDLVFPHHENEIAQSRCAFHAPLMAKTWMHNGFLQVEGEKMSKSLGNFVTINELLRTEKFGGRNWSGQVLRFAMLRTHYRSPIDWTVAALAESERALMRLSKRIKQFDFALQGLPTRERNPSSTPTSEILEALADDLNTPLVLSRIHDLDNDDAIDQALLAVGIDVRSYAKWVRGEESQVDRAGVDALIAARLEARKSKNFAESDRIRDELKAMGVVIKDNKDGTTTWEIAR
ncbi:MAG: cysteine--tRNA ligase, partial [Xanthobacteraceae bacterium]|nr:cysteine--tRNA ligase [Xanthobacteraceae bacterium]